MRHILKRWERKHTSLLRIWWANHRISLLRLAIAIMVVLALLKLGDEFRRLIWETGHSGAVDLKLRHNEVHSWFAGKPFRSVYPPASYVILWPLLGWLTLTPARWLWAATSVAALAWLAYLIVRESGASTHLERIFVALMLLSMNATGVTIGNGQLIIHVLPMLLAGLLLFHRSRCRWHEALLASVLIMVSLVQPSISTPFLWIVLFVPRKLRPAWLVGLGYVALTLLATSFREPGLMQPVLEWPKQGMAAASWGSIRGGYANLHTWLGMIGLKQWNLPASLLVLAALGFWTYRHRHEDLWLLLGVAALVARFWTYHRVYNDSLVLLPMVTLFRIAKRGPSTNGGDVVAGLLLAITVLAMLAPARLIIFPPPWNLLFRGGHAIVWIIVLIFLLNRAWREKNAAVG